MEKTEIKDFVKTKRPNLSAGTLTTYTSIITNLYKKVFGSTDKYDLEKFNTDYKEVLNFLKDIPADRRKTTLAAMVVIVDEDVKDNYRKQMMSDIEESRGQDILQKKSAKQEANWVSQQEIKEVYERLYSKIENLSKKNLTVESMTTIRDVILLALTSGIYIPPRRSQDWSEMKIKGINKDTDNYLLKNKFVFNTYKTAKTYGRETIDVPPDLQVLLKKYISLLPSGQEYLLVNGNGRKMTSVSIALALNKIFSKAVSVNMLRHSYLTEKYKDVPALTDMMDTARQMGHSLTQGLTYVKR
jgi:integrase